MNQEDRDRLVRIETILEEVVAPQLKSYGPRVRRLETVVASAGVVWGGICVAGYVLKDTVSEWIKQKLLGHG